MCERLNGIYIVCACVAFCEWCHGRECIFPFHLKERGGEILWEFQVGSKIGKMNQMSDWAKLRKIYLNIHINVYMNVYDFNINTIYYSDGL